MKISWKKRSKYPFFFLILLSGLLIGCGDMPTSSSGNDGSSSTPTPEPTSTKAFLRLINNDTDESVYYFYITPSSNSSWGSDFLGSGTLGPGQTFTINNIPCNDTYDFAALGSSQTRGAIQYNINFSGVCGGGKNWTITSFGNVSFPSSPLQSNNAQISSEQNTGSSVEIGGTQSEPTTFSENYETLN